jgi:hypothetical protein
LAKETESIGLTVFREFPELTLDEHRRFLVEPAQIVLDTAILIMLANRVDLIKTSRVTGVFFYGGQLDFFANERYKKFARLMIPSTFTFRTDEQVIMGIAWSVLADKVWYLPKRGIYMSVYHHGWNDNSEVIRVRPGDNQHSKFTVNTLE